MAHDLLSPFFDPQRDHLGARSVSGRDEAQRWARFLKQARIHRLTSPVPSIHRFNSERLGAIVFLGE